MNREDIKGDFILLNVGSARHNADWNWTNVCSPFARIHLVRRGTAEIVRDDGVCVLRENHLYLTPSYVKHSYRCNGVLELFYLHIYEDPGCRPSIFEWVRFPVEIAADTLVAGLVKRLLEINSGRELPVYDPQSYDNSATFADNMARLQHRPIACELETQGILKQLIARFLVHSEQRMAVFDKRILESLYFIHKHIARPPTIECLAASCFMTKDHYIRLFRKEMHCTPWKYIIRKRIELAQLKLLLDQSPVNDIACALGFESVPYFNHLFKQMTGESPGRYKKKMLRR
jgi:AraC-like DNA-binding protein